MYIIESIQFELESTKYFPSASSSLSGQHSISYVCSFFFDGIYYIYRSGAAEFINTLKNKERDGILFQETELSMDFENNLVYISESYDDFKRKTTPELDKLIEAGDTIELCHRNFVGYTTMSQENFYQLLLTWEKIVDDRAPFLLIYLDDKGWYDSLPFDTQEAMEKFVADHTPSEAIQK